MTRISCIEAIAFNQNMSEMVGKRNRYVWYASDEAKHLIRILVLECGAT
jgi:hypothetical protein